MELKLSFFIFFILIFSSSISQVKLIAKVDKNKLDVNQHLRIEFSINKKEGANFTPPHFNDFKVISGPRQSVSQSWVDNEVVFKQSYTYILIPKKRGTLQISSANIKVNNKLYRTNPVSILVNSEEKINKKKQEYKTSNLERFSQADIKKLALQINKELKGLDLGNGVKVKGCFSIGRTLVYQYYVPEYWEASKGLKKLLITNLKTAGSAKEYFLNDINVDFYYFKGNALVKKVSVKSNEFSTFNYELGEYFSTKNHFKAKSVNLKLKVPIGWEQKEGDRPNIVKKFVKDGNAYLILIKENTSFISRREMKEILQNENYIDEYIQEVSLTFKNPQVLAQSVMTIDTYPTIQFKIKVTMERLGINIPIIMRSWNIFYEDKIITLMCSGGKENEFNALEKLYFSITNSVIFPEQYN